MNHARRNAVIALVLLLVLVFGCMFAADRIQRGNGTIAVTEGWIETNVGDLLYKLYTPKTATAETPVPVSCCCTATRMTTRPARPMPSSLQKAAL